MRALLSPFFIFFSIALATPHPHPSFSQLDATDLFLTLDPDYQQEQEQQQPFHISTNLDLLPPTDNNIDDEIWFTDPLSATLSEPDSYLSLDDINPNLDPNSNPFDFNPNPNPNPNLNSFDPTPPNLYLSSNPSSSNDPLIFDDNRSDPTARCPLDFYIYPACCGRLLSNDRYIPDCNPSA